MNNKYILTSAIAISLIVAGLLLYNVRLPIEADSLIGFGTVLTVAGVGAIEYRLHGRRPLSE
jgi:hypothetical protein